MTMNFSTTLRTARGQTTINQIDAGGGGLTTTAMMHFYNGPRPAAGVAITTETLIGSCALSDPCGTVANGVVTFNTISDDVSVDADEDIAWCRIVDSDGDYVIDLGCGLTGSGQEIIFNSVTGRIGGVLQILSGSFTEGNI